jgi:hypothetical protein
MRHHLYEFWPAYAAIAVATLFIVLVVPYSEERHRRWESWCYGQGGWIDVQDATITIPYADGSGRTYPETMRTYTCHAPDGRVLGTKK